MNIMNNNLSKLKIQQYKNRSGSLLSLEKLYSLIKVKNSFIIKSNKNNIRGNHAHKKATQLIFCIKGEVNVSVKNFLNKKTYLIKEEQNSCLIVPRYNWVQLKFLKKSIILVLSSEKYSEKEYIRNYSEFLNLNKK